MGLQYAGESVVSVAQGAWPWPSQSPCFREPSKEEFR